MLVCILSKKKISKHPDFKELKLPQRNPFIISLLTGDNQHKEDFIITFHLMIKLRQLSFPSPLLDGTRDPYVAAFFALSNTEVNECASIFRIKSKSQFQPFDLQLDVSDFYFSADNIIGLRHNNQKSVYLLVREHPHADTCLPKDQQRGPIIHLAGSIFDEFS